VKIDKLALNHFDDSDDFARAMKLMHESVATLTQSQSFADYEENFLADLDELDEWLLSKAERFNQAIQSEFKMLQQEIMALRDILKDNRSLTTPEEQERLLTRIRETINPSLPDKENPTLEELFTLWQENNKPNLVETSFVNALDRQVTATTKIYT